MIGIWQRLEEYLSEFDGDFRAEVWSQCMWSGTLRLTLTNPPQEPSRSIAFFAVACLDPEEAAARVLDDAAAWLVEADPGPLSPEEVMP